MLTNEQKEATTFSTEFVEETNSWHCTVELNGQFIHTTEAYDDEDSARWSAIDWVNAQ